jgi:hypothetical protein
MLCLNATLNDGNEPNNKQKQQKNNHTMSGAGVIYIKEDSKKRLAKILKQVWLLLKQVPPHISVT